MLFQCNINIWSQNRLQCDIQLLENYAHYEAIFERSLTPTTVASTPTPTSADDTEDAQSKTKNNYFSVVSAFRNPYLRFVGQYDHDISIETTSDGLERFHRNLEAPPPPPDEFDNLVLPNIHSAPISPVSPVSPVTAVATALNNKINNNDAILPPSSVFMQAVGGVEQPFPSQVTDTDPKVFKDAKEAASKSGGRKANHSKSKKKAKNKAAAAAIAFDPNKVIAEGTIMYLNSEDDNSEARAKDGTDRPYLVYHNGLFVDPSMSNEDMYDAEDWGWCRPINANPIAGDTTTPVVPQDDNNSNPIASTNTTTTTTSTCQLRKNTPDGLPLIIKQAIEIKEESPLKKKKIQRHSGMGLNINLANEAAPETPLIEAAPTSIDFIAALSASTDNAITVNHNADDHGDNEESVAKIAKLLDEAMTFDKDQQDEKDHDQEAANIKTLQIDDEPESDFNKAVNALQYDEPIAMDLDQHIPPQTIDQDEIPVISSGEPVNQRRKTINAFKSSKPVDDCISDDSDEDNELPEFNSANFWYINPLMPLDLDILANVNNNDDEEKVETPVREKQMLHMSPREEELSWDDPISKFREKGKCAQNELLQMAFYYVFHFR